MILRAWSALVAAIPRNETPHILAGSAEPGCKRRLLGIVESLLHFGDASHESDYAGQYFDFHLAHQEWDVGHLGAQEERIKVLGGEFLIEWRVAGDLT